MHTRYDRNVGILFFRQLAKPNLEAEKRIALNGGVDNGEPKFGRER